MYKNNVHDIVNVNLTKIVMNPIAEPAEEVKDAVGLKLVTGYWLTRRSRTWRCWGRCSPSEPWWWRWAAPQSVQPAGPPSHQGGWRRGTRPPAYWSSSGTHGGSRRGQSGGWHPEGGGGRGERGKRCWVLSHYHGVWKSSVSLMCCWIKVETELMSQDSVIYWLTDSLHRCRCSTWSPCLASTAPALAWWRVTLPFSRLGSCHQ